MTGVRFLAEVGKGSFSSSQLPDQLSVPLHLVSDWYRGFAPWDKAAEAYI